MTKDHRVLHEQFTTLVHHHAACHERFEQIEAAMHAAAPLVPRDTPEGKAWHAEFERLVAVREAMFDPKWKASEETVRRYAQQLDP